MTMMTRRRVLPCLALVSLAASCALPSQDVGDDDSEPIQCRRLEVLVDDHCEKVVVTGVETRDFAFERANWRLDGTLWVPIVEQADYQPPGVVIIHGSGPQDRDGLVAATLGINFAEPIPIYASLAEQLAAQGFAVLSHDKRSCFVENKPECPRSITEYPDDLEAMRVGDFLEDARVAAQALAAEPGIAPDIIVVGHSKGASYVPTLVHEEEVIHGGVMLAGPMLSVPESIGGQLEDYADWLETHDPGNPLIEQLRGEAVSIRDTLESMLAGTYAGSHYLGASVDYWLDWMAHQASFPAALAQVEEPIAAYFGNLDFNVGARHVEELEAWIDAGSVDVELRDYADLTHVFVYLVDDPPGHTTEFARDVVDDLVSWAVVHSPKID
jgi:predicted esterase